MLLPVTELVKIMSSPLARRFYYGPRAVCLFHIAAFFPAIPADCARLLATRSPIPTGKLNQGLIPN